MPDINRIVYEVLSQIGNHREARYFFELFNHDDPMRFALVAFDDLLVQKSENRMGSAIGLLYHLGLLPIILHSNQISNDLIISKLKANNVAAKGVSLNLLQNKIDLNSIQKTINNHKIPVVNGIDVDEHSLGEALSFLSKSILPHKIIILSEQGGLIDDSGRVISNINLDSGLEKEIALPFIQSTSLLSLTRAHELLKQMPSQTSIAVTSVQNLVKELFTYKGAGTLIRIEDKVEVHCHFDSLLEAKLGLLIEASFNRNLNPDYFTAINLDKLFVSQSGSAMAVVLKNEKNIPYLDKFIVTPEAQGVGLGKVIWKKLIQEYDQLYWRARVNNPINNWYLRQADSTKREGEWIVFGQNIPADQWPNCINDALSRTIYMVDK